MNDIGLIGAALFSGLFVSEVEEAIKEGDLKATEAPDGNIIVEFNDVIDWLAEKGETWTQNSA